MIRKPHKTLKKTFKSGKMRRLEIKAMRIEKALQSQDVEFASLQKWSERKAMAKKPAGAIWADPAHMVSVSAYPVMPLYYADKAFTCARCGQNQLWTAKQQKWWYEIAQGELQSTAKHCRPCRHAMRAEKNKAKATHYTGLIAKYGVKDTARRLKLSVAELSDWRDKNIV